MTNNQIRTVIEREFILDEETRTSPEALAQSIYFATLVCSDLREEIIRRGTLQIAKDIIEDLK